MLNLVSMAAASEEPYLLLLPIGLILLFAKVFAIIASRLHLPEVIGYLVGGLAVGLITFIPGQTVLTDYTTAGIDAFGKIGVILLLFTAGVETDLKKIKAVGVASVVITSLGVIVPLLIGLGLAYAFRISDNIYTNLYYGVILTATSVSITVATLKELHKLDTPVGSAIVSAAILDDIIGIILLSLVISLAGGESGTVYVSNTGLNILIILLVMIGFFVLSFILGIFVRKIFVWLDAKWPHHRRIPIFSLAFCFILAYVAKEFFNIADITGAYVAGLILSTTRPSKYIDQRAESVGTLMFTPIFFASIALMMYTKMDLSDLSFLWFGIAWVILGAFGKVIGAGAGALICRFNFKDSLRIGSGMMARAEVVIVCAQMGVDSGIVSVNIMPFTIFIIILTSFITPLFLQLLYRNGDSPHANLKSAKVDSDIDPEYTEKK